MFRMTMCYYTVHFIHKTLNNCWSCGVGQAGDYLLDLILFVCVFQMFILKIKTLQNQNKTSLPFQSVTLCSLHGRHTMTCTGLFSASQVSSSALFNWHSGLHCLRLPVPVFSKRGVAYNMNYLANLQYIFTSQISLNETNICINHWW